MNKSQALPKLDKTQARPGTSILHRQPASPNLMLDGPSESPPLATCCCCWESLLFELDKLLSQQSFDFAGNRGCLHQTSVANALIVIELSWQPSNVSCFAAWARTTPTTSEYYSGGGRTVVTGLQDTDPRKSNIYIYIFFPLSLSLCTLVCITRCTIFIYFLHIEPIITTHKIVFLYIYFEVMVITSCTPPPPGRSRAASGRRRPGLQHKALEAQGGGFGSGWIDGLMMVDDGWWWLPLPSGKLT